MIYDKWGYIKIPTKKKRKHHQQDLILRFRGEIGEITSNLHVFYLPFLTLLP